MPKAWYNLRADMKNKPAPLLNPGTLQPMTREELDGVFCDELVQQELDDKYTPQEMERFAEMLRDASRLLDDLDKDYNDSHYYEAVEPRSHRQIPRGNQ